MKSLTVTTALALLAFTSGVSAAKADQESDCDRQSIGGIFQPVTGAATLCVARKGLKGSMNARDLVPGEAYTVWWVYFDDPSQCADPGACGPVDFAGPDPLGVVGRMDSVVAPPRGRARLSGEVRGMRPSSGSQVWYFMFGHGPADTGDARHLARQLLTPEDPSLGTPHLGNGVDGPLGFPAALAVFVVD